MSEITIKDLKKNDRFVFNNKTYIVTNKYRESTAQLKALDENNHQEQLFFYEGLSIEKI